jgi:hypothetical protein
MFYMLLSIYRHMTVGLPYCMLDVTPTVSRSKNRLLGDSSLEQLVAERHYTFKRIETIIEYGAPFVGGHFCLLRAVLWARTRSTDLASA